MSLIAVVPYSRVVVADADIAPMIYVCVLHMWRQLNACECLWFSIVEEAP